ncbi:MAG: hypothetical protein JJU21_17705 [Salinarimonas sp.]|nr:hypothetical protein [Salinarimonas sp.]
MQRNAQNVSLSSGHAHTGEVPSFKRAAMGFAASIAVLCMAAFFLGSL